MVLTNRLLNIDMKTLEPCNHTEADTRTCIFLHLAHAAYQGHEKAFVRIVDSATVVLALSLFENVMLAELWIGFLSGKSYRDIPVHKYSKPTARSIKVISVTIVSLLNRLWYSTFPMFWAVARRVPGMHGKIFLTETWIALTKDPECLILESVHMERVERFVVLRYSKTCASSSVYLKSSNRQQTDTTWLWYGMTIYLCRFGQPLLKQARHVPSSYTVVVQRHVRRIVEQVSDAHCYASAGVDALTVMRQYKFSYARYYSSDYESLNKFMWHYIATMLSLCY